MDESKNSKLTPFPTGCKHNRFLLSSKQVERLDTENYPDPTTPKKLAMTPSFNEKAKGQPMGNLVLELKIFIYLCMIAIIVKQAFNFPDQLMVHIKVCFSQPSG